MLLTLKVEKVSHEPRKVGGLDKLKEGKETDSSLESTERITALPTP